MDYMLYHTECIIFLITFIFTWSNIFGTYLPWYMYIWLVHFNYRMEIYCMNNHHYCLFPSWWWISVFILFNLFIAASKGGVINILICFPWYMWANFPVVKRIMVYPYLQFYWVLLNCFLNGFTNWYSYQQLTSSLVLWFIRLSNLFPIGSMWIIISLLLKFEFLN